MTQERINRTTLQKKLGIQRNQFMDIQDKDLRCRNIAVMILNYVQDHGQEAGLLYSTVNVTDADENHVRSWVAKLAKERGMLEEDPSHVNPA